MEPVSGAQATAAPLAVQPVDAMAAALEPVFARVHGEPLMRLPLDLYIPPDALEVFRKASKVRWTCCFTSFASKTSTSSISRWPRSRASTWSMSSRSAATTSSWPPNIC